MSAVEVLALGWVPDLYIIITKSIFAHAGCVSLISNNSTLNLYLLKIPFAILDWPSEVNQKTLFPSAISLAMIMMCKHPTKLYHLVF